MQIRRARRTPKQGPLVYYRAALTPVAQLAPLALAFLAALVTLSLLAAVVALAVAEALVFALLPRWSVFQRAIDRRVEEEARAAAAAERASLFAQMTELHASELAELERLTADVRADWAVEPVGGPYATPVDRVLDLERLLASYVRIALGYRRSVECFSIERKLPLDEQSARLAAMPVPERGPSSDWIARRRTVLALRQGTWARASEEREAMLHALATIAEVIRWVHDLRGVPADDPGRGESDRVLAGCAAALAELRCPDADVAIDFPVLSTSSAPAATVLC